MSEYHYVTTFKVDTTYTIAFNVTRHALNAQNTNVAEEMRMTKTGEWGQST